MGSDIKIKVKLAADMDTPESIRSGFKKPSNQVQHQNSSLPPQNQGQSSIGSFGGGRVNSDIIDPKPIEPQKEKTTTPVVKTPSENSMVGGFGTPTPSVSRPTTTNFTGSTPKETTQTDSSSQDEAKIKQLKSSIEKNEQRRKTLFACRKSVGKYVAGLAVCGGIAFILLDFVLAFGISGMMPAGWIVFLVILSVILIIAAFTFIPKISSTRSSNALYMKQIKTLDEEINDQKADLRYLERNK